MMFCCHCKRPHFLINLTRVIKKRFVSCFFISICSCKVHRLRPIFLWCFDGSSESHEFPVDLTNRRVVHPSCKRVDEAYIRIWMKQGYFTSNPGFVGSFSPTFTIIPSSPFCFVAIFLHHLPFPGARFARVGETTSAARWGVAREFFRGEKPWNSAWVSHRCPKFPLVAWWKSKGFVFHRLPRITIGKSWCRWYTRVTGPSSYF